MFNKTCRVAYNTNVSNYCLIFVELNGIERQLIKFGQARCLKQLRKKLEENLPLFKSVCSAAILKRTPILLDDVIRMQGRLSKAPVAFDVRYPILLPINSRLSQLIVDSCDQICGHSGLNHRTFSVLRNQYWLPKASGFLKKPIKNCVTCQKLKAKILTQVMADLPSARLQTFEPPFAHTGEDYFGPFLTKRGRSHVKRYGCLFTCLITRTVDSKMGADLTTDSF